MRISIIGMGYVGLVGGAGFAESGATVVCSDIDEAKVAHVNAGCVPIFEPGLEEMIERNRTAARLSFSTDLKAAIEGAEVVIVAVGTPPREDGSADTSVVEAVARAVAEHAAGPLVLVIKSTVPVGTNAVVRGLVEACAHRIHVVSNPEFLKEGHAIADFMRPDRIVVGCDDDDVLVRDLMTRLYHPFTLSGDRIVWMDPASAELTKYVANTMLAMRISFMNEVASLCDHVGADIHDVRLGIGSDPRIGSRFLYAGPGYGGSCFAKDVAALVQTGRCHDLELELASATERVNERQQGALVRKLRGHFDGGLRGRRIGVWGLAFKPRTDDIRRSPALALIDALLADGARVAAHDPRAKAQAARVYGDRIELLDDPYEAAKASDALVLVTEWREYQNPNFTRLKEVLARPLLIDGRNIWSSYGLRAQGFTYEGVGVRGS